MTGKRRMEKKHARGGFVLGYVLMLMMVLTMMVMMAAAFTSSYVSGGQRSRCRTQVAVTARTTAKAVASDMENPPEEGSLRTILEKAIKEGDTVLSLEGLDEDMGSVWLELTYLEETGSLYVTVCAERMGAEAKITAGFSRGMERDGKTHKPWELLGYQNGEWRGTWR